MPRAEKSDVRSDVRPVMPTQVGIHDLRLLHAAKAWMPTCVGMTVGAWAEQSAISALGML
jgi:hypothetical protein